MYSQYYIDEDTFECYCDRHTKEEYPLPFQEMDSVAHCSECGMVLAVSLTTEGMENLEVSIKEFACSDDSEFYGIMESPSYYENSKEYAYWKDIMEYHDYLDDPPLRLFEARIEREEDEKFRSTVNRLLPLFRRRL